MKKVLLKSVYEAFDYVMDHYYPYGQEQYGTRSDTYAVISIQDTHTDGFGFVFTENQFCKAVLTLYFDDIIKEAEGAKLFSSDDANKIIDFVLTNRKSFDTLIVHCYGGESRSRAVAAFIVKMFGQDNRRYFETGNPNEYVYHLLSDTWKNRNHTA